MPRRTTTASSQVFQLKVTLQEVEPPVWRRLLVPGGLTLAQLHRVLNEAMGWTDSHLHVFKAGDRHFGDPRADDAGELGFEDERRMTLERLGALLDFLVYAYDFGDGWEHTVLVEQVVEPDAREHYPLCTAGARACPPEDCGGPHAYADLLEALDDPEHERYDEFLTWVGGVFDPEGFDVNRTNAALWALKLPG